jgi:hypothetical protein
MSPATMFADSTIYGRDNGIGRSTWWKTASSA